MTSADGSDLQTWGRLVAAYHHSTGLRPPGPTEQTDRARRDAARSASGTDGPRIDLYVDPACPYTWLAARWLDEVERQRPVDLRYHVMSLGLLNEHRELHPDYRAAVDQGGGPARVATAILTHHGHRALRSWHAAFGAKLFGHWHLPTPEEYDAASRHALAEAGLPVRLAAAARSPEYDESLRRSHEQGVRPVGDGCGTPVVHVDGAAFFGPVLNATVGGMDALRLFDGIRLLATLTDFYELKRTRTRPPDLGPARSTHHHSEAEGAPA